MLYEDVKLLATDELLSLPPAKWLMRDLIPEEGFVGLYGAPASGKSFIAIDWAVCISEGIPWLGEFETRQSPVVYVAAEGGRGIQQRVRAQLNHRQLRDLPAIYWLLSPLYVREEGTVERFLDELDRRDIWPGLIVLDTLSRSFGGGEENASEDMGHFVDQMTKLALGRRMAALVVHHKNATGVRERGHTSFRGAADAMFACAATRDKMSGRIVSVELLNDKQKDSVEVEPIYLKPIEGVAPSLIFEKTEPPPKRERGTGPPVPMRKVDMLTVLGAQEDGLTFSEWRLASGIAKATFSRRVSRLIKDGEVYKDNGRYYAVPSVTDLAGLEDEEEG